MFETYKKICKKLKELRPPSVTVVTVTEVTVIIKNKIKLYIYKKLQCYHPDPGNKKQIHHTGDNKSLCVCGW